MFLGKHDFLPAATGNMRLIMRLLQFVSRLSGSRTYAFSEQHRVQPVLGLAKLPFVFAFTPYSAETFYALYPTCQTKI